MANGEDKSGTTAICVLISEKYTIFSNCGDSRGVLSAEGSKPVLVTEVNFRFLTIIFFKFFYFLWFYTKKGEEGFSGEKVYYCKLKSLKPAVPLSWATVNSDYLHTFFLKIKVVFVFQLRWTEFPDPGSGSWNRICEYLESAKKMALIKIIN